MSADREYGDPCDNDECPKQRDGKCRKNEEFYDASIDPLERLELLTLQLSAMVEMHAKLGMEIGQLIKIGMALSHDIPDVNGDTKHESIDDILSNIENSMK